ncbi:MAG: PadR family transcriptional regulator, partial [Nitrospirota bacterium]
MRHGHCGNGFNWAFAVRPENLGFDPGAFWAGRGKSRGGPFGGARMFDQGHLKFVILNLLAEKPRHGYE